MPDEPGIWKFQIRSQPIQAGLTDVEGTFTCSAAILMASDTPFDRRGAVRVSGNQHYLEFADGTPFFWLGDTAWSGPALCETLEEWDHYLRTRHDQGFTAVQFNSVSPWRAAPTDAEGRTGFLGREDVRIDPAYFQRLDRFVDAINRQGLLAAPVLLWSLKADDPGSYLSEEDCIRLVRYQVARYQGHHVLWILAGDNHYDEQTTEKWKRVGRAVFGTGENPRQAPVTTHPSGRNWPWETWRDEEWLTVLSYQSGHGDDDNAFRWLHSGPPHCTWDARPVINLEPPYEGHNGYASKQPHTDRSVRRATYWSLLATRTAGVSYGGQGVWSWHTKEGEPPTDHPGAGAAPHWRDALKFPGALQMRHVRDLFCSLPWWSLRPAEHLLLTQPGSENPAQYLSVSKSEDDRILIAYLPVGGEIALTADALPQKERAEWFSPRDGSRISAERLRPGVFSAPDNQDWVLLLEAGH